MSRTRSGLSPTPNRSFLCSLGAKATLLLVAIAPDLNAQDLTRDYERAVRPILRNFCFECHSANLKEAEIDLARYRKLPDLRKDIKTWVKVRRMLESAQMPPKEAKQLSDAERVTVRKWLRAFLLKEAQKHAGDPGPVLLRRLSNAEYTYTIRDLTGIKSLDPTREFPVDGAAGEGFTNTGAALVMSPSLVTKYLDAAKKISDHLVLLPDGIAFSAHTSERDQSDELIAKIQAFYRQFTADGGGQAVNLQGIKFDTNQGGVLPINRYLLATIEERETLRSGKKSLAQVAKERSINTKYLTTLWSALEQKGKRPSFLIQRLRSQWSTATPADVPSLVAEINARQKQLWKYNSIGHIGEDAKPKVWMEGVNPLVHQQQFQVKLSPDGDYLTVHLCASDGGDGKDNDIVQWINPRLSGKGLDIPLRDAVGLDKKLKQLRKEVFARTTDYLAAVAELKRTGSLISPEAKVKAAKKHKLNVEALSVWMSYLGLRSSSDAVQVKGHFTRNHKNTTYPFVKGWGTPETPIIVANSSDNQVRVPGIARPHSVYAHPSPTLFAGIGWRSPISGAVQIESRVADAHPECGNGQEWVIQHRTHERASNIWKGDFAVGKSAKMPPKKVLVRKGELISFILGPKGGSHACDLTEVSFLIRELEGKKRVWDLAKDVADDLDSHNPHGDGFGNAATWHFYKGPWAEVLKHSEKFDSLPLGSLIDKWNRQKTVKGATELATKVQALVLGAAPKDAKSPDGQLYRQLHTMTFSSDDLRKLLRNVTPDSRFGKHPTNEKIDSRDLIVQAPHDFSIRISRRLIEGRSLVTTGRLLPDLGREGSVHLEVQTKPVQLETLGVNKPRVVVAGSASEHRAVAEFEAYRGLFPSTLCYARIVPVDEVVTSTLYYRQDDALQRLMLNKSQTEQLDRLWDQLFYVSHEPLKYQVAFEQIRAFATQDRPDLVKIWSPLVKSVDDRAAAFRRKLRETEAVHLKAILEFADRAWRRPLTRVEKSRLRSLYQQLRETDIAHVRAIRLVLARVLTSPAFLYRREAVGPGREAVDVSDRELASRLSYFLWSSLPDAKLQNAIEAKQLTQGDTLVSHARRMLKDKRTRRLAIHFACQWLHLRDFDQNDDKNEKLYPEFSTLRGSMYEETVRFFEHMFREDGSILDMIDADFTFLNESLASHYGIPSVKGPEFRRVANVKGYGRGGVMGMASFLASQSGASRTSPILRGNWIYETLLGKRLPKPPANVPQLPEQVPSGLTARQLIERHSSVEACAKCHRHIDPFGFSLEQFDAIGRIRTAKVDTKTELPDGRSIMGLAGLKDYLKNDRKDEIVEQFCRKLLGFALGRETQLSDEPLLENMKKQLQQQNYRFSVAVEAIVTSPQFRQIRGKDRQPDD